MAKKDTKQSETEASAAEAPKRTKYGVGIKVMYKDRVVNVVQDRGTNVRIQDNGREFDVKPEVLTALPEDAKVTSRGKLGKGSVIPKEIRKQYKVHKVKTATGKSNSIDNDDETAAALRGKSLDDAYKAAVEELKKHGEETTVAALKEKYSGLNPGMQRMNLGNRIRGAATKLATKQKRDKAKADREAKAKADREAKEAAADKAEKAAPAKAEKAAPAKAPAKKATKAAAQASA